MQAFTGCKAPVSEGGGAGPPKPAGERAEQVVRGKKATAVIGASGRKEEFDEVVFCCGAEEALRLLGPDASW